MKHTVREMLDSDLDNAVDLLGEAYAYLADQEGFTAEERDGLIRERGSREALLRQMGEYRFYVLVREGILAGILALKGPEITKLFVHPSEVRSGIGSMLFEAAQRTIVRGGYDLIIVGTTGHAVPFYLAHGMEISGTRTAEEGPLKGRKITVLKKHLHTLDTTRIIRHDTGVHL